MSKDAKKKNKRKAKSAPKPAEHQFWRVCGILTALGIILLCWISLMSYSPDDPGWYQRGSYSPALSGAIRNYGGEVGAYLADAMRY